MQSLKMRTRECVLPVYFYVPPNGQCKLIDCRAVYPEDHDYFLNNDIRVSMEELNGEYIVYGCPESDPTEESEIIVFAGGRSCEDTLQDLAKRCKEEFGDENERRESPTSS